MLRVRDLQPSESGWVPTDAVRIRNLQLKEYMIDGDAEVSPISGEGHHALATRVVDGIRVCCFGLQQVESMDQLSETEQERFIPLLALTQLPLQEDGGFDTPGSSA